MLRRSKYWRDRADEVRAIAEGMTGEEPKRMMLRIACDYDRFAKGAGVLEWQKERDEQEARRSRQQQATTSLLDTPFSTDAKQVIDKLIKAPFSRVRVR
jgi:hypothetical protein